MALAPAPGVVDVEETQRLALLAGVTDVPTRTLLIDLQAQVNQANGPRTLATHLYEGLRSLAPMVIAALALVLRH